MPTFLRCRERITPNSAARTHFQYFTQALGVDWTIKPTVLNSFRAGYLYNSAKYGYDLTPVWLTQPSINFAYGASGVELNNLPIGTILSTVQCFG